MDSLRVTHMPECERDHSQRKLIRGTTLKYEEFHLQIEIKLKKEK